MSVIQFQISTDAFLALQLSAVQQAPFCLPGPFTFGAVQVVVDHLEFLQNSIRHNVTITHRMNYEEIGGVVKKEEFDCLQTQLAQPVRIVLTKLSDVLAHPNNPPADFSSLDVTAVLNLDYFPTDESPDENCFFQAIVAGFEFGDLPPLPPGVDPETLKDKIRQLIRSAFPSPPVPFDFASLLADAALSEKGVPLKGIKVENAGVSVSADGSFLSFAAQLGQPSRDMIQTWTGFFAGGADNQLGGLAFALFVPKDYFASVVELSIEQQLRAQDSKFDLIAGVSTYENNGGGVRIVSDLGGNLHLPDPLTTTYIETEITSDYTISAPNTMTTSVTLPGRDELVNALLGPVGGALRIMLPFSFFFLGLAQSIATQAQQRMKPTVPSCKKTGANQFTCTQSFPAPSVLGGTTANFTKLLGLDDGVSLGGTMNTQPLTPATISVRVNQFQWMAPRISCGSAGIVLAAAFQNDPSSLADLHANVFLDVDGTVPVFLCTVQVLNDPARAFPNSGIRFTGTALPLQITVDVPVPPPAYYNAPYTCDLLITTTAGTRLARLNPAPLFTQKDIDKMQADIIFALGNCEQQVDPWVFTHKGLNPKWGIDPPFERPADHLWQIDISNLTPGEPVTIVDAHGQQLMQATARAGAPLLLTARVEPAGAKELTILPRGVQHEQSARTERVRVGSLQQLLYPACSVPLQAPCERLQVVNLNGRGNLIAVGSGRLAQFDVSKPFQPALLVSLKNSGLQGAVGWANQLLVYGDGGFYAVASFSRLRPAGRGCDPQLVIDAVAGSDVLYAITTEGLEVFSPQLCRIALTELHPAARTMLRLGNYLLTGGSSGLTVFSMRDRHKPHPQHTLNGLPVTSLALYPAASGGFVAGLEDGSARLFQLEDGYPVEYGHFSRPPWFASAVRIGRVIGDISEDRFSIRLAVRGESLVA
jgi:hypothetical protein